MAEWRPGCRYDRMMTGNSEPRGALVLLLAHPDDETFFAAGTIAQAAASGRRVGLLCATRGDRGATGGVCTIEELPEVREAELREAARILGIHEVDMLPFEDQQLS